MEEEHKLIFWEVADSLQCWIGVREPNPYSQDYMGAADAIPKPEECKAKTADNPDSDLKGLVVDPTERPDAFRSGSVERAIGTWKEKFLTQKGGVPDGFTVDRQGPDRGLVRMGGMKIFSDYDLMTLVKSNEAGQYLSTDTDQLKALAYRVEGLLNRLLPKPMIQHGPEFLFDGVGGKHGEFVLWFGPGQRFFVGPSSVDEKMMH